MSAGPVQNQITSPVQITNPIVKPSIGVRMANWADRHSTIAKALKWGTPMVSATAGALTHFSICGWTLQYALVSLAAMSGGGLLVGLLSALTVAGLVNKAAKNSLEQSTMKLLELGLVPGISEDQNADLRAELGHVLAKGMANSDKVYPGEALEGGRYLVIKQLGAGAMGEAYLAEEVMGGRKARKVVVKRVIPDTHVVNDETRRKGLLRECQVLARVEHPNVVRIYNYIEDLKGYPAFVMPFIKGTELRHKISAMQIDPVRAVDIVLQASEGLEAIHKEGIVHRDLKPENIMILDEDGRVIIFDFGIAKDEGDTTKTVTSADAIFGTPEYMTPEQCLVQLELISWKTDMHALGAILWRMLTGAVPFITKKRGDYEKIIYLLKEIIENPLGKFTLPNTEWDSKLDERLDEDIAGHLYNGSQLPTRREFIQYVFERIMAKRPEDRYGGYETGPKVIKQAGFTDFDEMLQGMMWDALKEAGYIREVQNRYGETLGIISEKFTGKRDEFGLPITLNTEDESKIFQMLQQAPNRVILVYEEGKHDYLELRRDLAIMRAVFERVTAGTMVTL